MGPGEYFGLRSLIRYFSSLILKTTYGLQFLVVYGNVSADAFGVICHQLGLLCTDLHAICSGGLFKVMTNLTSSRSCPAGLSMPASDANGSFMVFKCFLHGLQVCQPLFSLRRYWRGLGRADILGALQLWFGTILLCCCHGRLHLSSCCRDILWFWSGCHWCYIASWLPTKLHAILCRTPSLKSTKTW